ncbi:MAG: methyltransferase domain-containing protein [Patescibacteria group bacterium]
MFARPDKIISQFKLGAGMKVADLGVGAGAHALEALKEVGDNGAVYAIDVQKDLLAKVKKEAHAKGFKNLHVIWSDLESDHATTLADGFLDAAIVSNVLFQIEARDRFAQEVARILRPGGKVLIVDWTDSFGGMGPHTDAVFGKNAARTLFEQAGLEFEQDVDAGSHHYGMILRKKK